MTKTFKSMTIGNNTFQLADNLGKTVYTQVLKNVPTANTNIVGATYTIGETGLGPGTYLAIAHWVFPSASTTGNRISSVCVGFKHNGDATYRLQKWMYEGSPGNNYMHIFAVATFAVYPTNLPCEVASIAKSTATSSTQDYSTIYLCKLINTER